MANIPTSRRSSLLLLLLVLLFGGARSEPAKLHGRWNAGRSIRTSHHFSCTLHIDKPEDYVAVDITNSFYFKVVQTWDVEMITSQFINLNNIVTTYQTESTAYPPRYVLHFIMEANFGGNDYTPNCTWRILQAPLTPPTTTTTTRFPAVTKDRDITLPTDSPGRDLFGLNINDACDYVTNNFKNGTPATPPPVFTLPPRGPPLRDLPRGRKKRDVSEYPEVDYTRAIDMSLSFFEAQRSGPLPAGSPNDWVKSTGLNHVTESGRDLTGGWYNGNDKVKTTLPIAYSTVMLQWGYYQWDRIYSKAGLEPRVLDTIQWGLEYLVKCWDSENKVLYTQVGNLALDRGIWERFDNAAYADVPVPIYHVTESSPTADVAANVATAFALAYVLVDDGYMNTTHDYLTLAKEVYEFARKNKGVAQVDNSSSEYPTYASTDYNDDLCLAASWLYFIEYDDIYFKQADRFFKKHTESQGDHNLFSWDDKYVTCALMLYDDTYEEEYRTFVINYLQHWVYGATDNDGFPVTGQIMSLQYIANAAFMGLLAMDYEVIYDAVFAKDIITWSTRNINRMLGWNPQGQSYLIGYSDKYPINPYHKNSACPSAPANCGGAFYESKSENTHVLTGALVGGPDGKGVYEDIRQNKLGNSVMLDYNAGFQSALAGLQSYRDLLERLCGRFSTAAPTTTTTTTTPLPTTDEMRTRYTTLQPSAAPPMPSSFNYTDALGKSILFYMAQKGGTIPSDYPVTWRKNETFTFLSGGGEGWFDDGSNIKTTIVMASSTSLLSWGALKFKTGYINAGQLDGLLTTLRASFNYLLECVEEASNGMATVKQKNGVEISRRSQWTRPSDRLTGSDRDEVLYAKGADIVGETATALVLGSQLFKDSDSNYSTTLLNEAVKQFNLLPKINGSYEDTASSFYSSPGDPNDEKCIAAVWLFRATGDYSYIGPIINSYKIVRQTDLSWKDKHVLCQLLLYETTGQSKYQDAVSQFLRHWMDSGVQYTPDGLAWYDSEGPLRYSANAAFVTLLAAELGITPSKSRSWARSQIDYMLGKNSNSFSYQIGYGDRYPTRPHHRASSCPDDLIPCDWTVYNSPRPNPHVLIGALVGGPNINDYHEDTRTNYAMNRVAVDYNAGFQATLAGLIELFPVTTTTTPRTTTTTTTTEPTTTTTSTTTTMRPTTTTETELRPQTKPITLTTTAEQTTRRQTTARPPQKTTRTTTTSAPEPEQTPNIPQYPTTPKPVSSSRKLSMSAGLVILTLIFQGIIHIAQF